MLINSTNAVNHQIWYLNMMTHYIKLKPVPLEEDLKHCNFIGITSGRRRATYEVGKNLAKETQRLPLSLRRARFFLGLSQVAKERCWPVREYILTPLMEVDLRVPPWNAILLCFNQSIQEYSQRQRERERERGWGWG